jgi:hypothetical protein
MTKDEIIEMARQAGFVDYELDDGSTNAFDKRYEAFAKLVAEKEREECAVFAEESFCGCGRVSCIDGDLRAHNIAESIRSRGDKND